MEVKFVKFIGVFSNKTNANFIKKSFRQKSSPIGVWR